MVEKIKLEKNSEGLSRRKLLAGAGALAVGVVASGGVLGIAKPTLAAGSPVNLVVNGKLIKTDVPAQIQDGRTLVPVRFVSEALGARVDWDNASQTVTISGKSVGDTIAVPAWPWPYKKVDPEVVRKRGYDNYFKGGCMYGAAAALIITLREEVGFPYDTIPLDVFKYGAGGSASWGTLCGALNGSSYVINLVNKDFSKLISELNGWYTEFPFPTNKHDAYAKFPKQVTTVAKSPLCHTSVSLWSKAAGAKVNSEEKKDRCGKLTGDTAARTVELLNQAVDGQLIAAYKPGNEFSHCMSCHTGKDSALDNEQGQMNCVSCHDSH